MIKKFSFKKFLTGLLPAIFFFLLLLFTKNDLQSIFPVSSQADTICVPIIMYHQVRETGLGKDVVSPYEFENDLIYLSESNYTTITMTQLIEYVYEDKELPNNPIIITIDDGYLTTYKYVYPLLKKYDMKIVLSLIGKDTDNFSKVFDDNIEYAYMTWDQINEMIASGHAEVQNHSYDLHHLGRSRVGCSQKKGESLEEYKKTITEDLGKLQERIALMTGQTPNTFTYPYGACSESTDAVLKDIGFKATLSCKYGVNVVTKNPEDLFYLKRICRSHNQGIKKMIIEGLETLKYSQKE